MRNLCDNVDKADNQIIQMELTPDYPWSNHAIQLFKNWVIFCLHNAFLFLSEFLQEVLFYDTGCVNGYQYCGCL